MAHESGPHRLFATGEFSSRPGVSPLCRALSGRHPATGILLLGSVSGYRLRVTVLSADFARHPGLSGFYAGHAVPPAIPPPSGGLVSDTPLATQSMHSHSPFR